MSSEMATNSAAVVEPKPVNVPALSAEKRDTIYPVYSWTTGKVFNLRKRHMIIAETFVETFDYKECVRRMLTECNTVTSVQAVRMVLAKPFVREWMEQKLRDKGITNSWTKERWMAVMTDHLNGVRRLQNGDLYAMKLIAGVIGIEMNDHKNSGNIQINVTQKNGME